MIGFEHGLKIRSTEPLPVFLFSTPASAHPKRAARTRGAKALRCGWFQRNVETVGCKCHLTHLGVSKNRGTPKWMVYDGKHY